MDVVLVAVGSELLHAGRRDTNTEWIGERILSAGGWVRARASVDDDQDRIARLLRAFLGEVDVVILTGGLGPTADDRTREGIASALDAPLVRDPEQVDLLRARFESRGYPFGSDQARQADGPPDAVRLPNRVGAAPGLWIERNGTALVALPGVPAEMRAMYDEEVEPRLESFPRHAIARRVLKVAGRTESDVDGRLRDLYGSPGTTATILAGARGIEVHLLCEGADRSEAEERLAGVEREVAERLGPDLYGRDEDTLAAVVGHRLRDAGLTLAAAESCSAGLLSGEITRVAGSSAWFRGGLVVYDNELKHRLAGVPADLLERDGAVSEPVAIALATGVRERCGADVGVGVTGIAGPGGGTADKPVGRVHIAVADAVGADHRMYTLPGDRDLVRARTVTLALDLLRRRLGEDS